MDPQAIIAFIFFLVGGFLILLWAAQFLARLERAALIIIENYEAEEGDEEEK